MSKPESPPSTITPTKRIHALFWRWRRSNDAVHRAGVWLWRRSIDPVHQAGVWPWRHSIDPVQCAALIAPYASLD